MSHLLLVEAMARLAGRLSIFCVFTGESGTTELLFAIQQAGLESAVAIQPSSRAARRLSAGADALVLPSQGNGPPVAVLEAFCDGTMVAAGDEPELLELVSDGETGLTFTFDDPDDLAAALVRLSTLSNQARREIRTRARALYSGKFSTTMMAQQYQHLYQCLQQAPPRTRPKRRVA